METKVGAYSEPQALNDHDKEVFEKAMAGLVGVTYTPTLVSKQIVAGVNYRFYCKTTTATLHPEEGGAIVSVFEELPAYGGKVVVSDILPFLK